MSLELNWRSKTLKLASKYHTKLFGWSFENVPRTPFCAHPAPRRSTTVSHVLLIHIDFGGKLTVKGASNKFSNSKKNQGGLPWYWANNLLTEEHVSEMLFLLEILTLHTCRCPDIQDLILQGSLVMMYFSTYFILLWPGQTGALGSSRGKWQKTSSELVSWGPTAFV